MDLVYLVRLRGPPFALRVSLFPACPPVPGDARRSEWPSSRWLAGIILTGQALSSFLFMLPLLTSPPARSPLLRFFVSSSFYFPLALSPLRPSHYPPIRPALCRPPSLPLLRLPGRSPGPDMDNRVRVCRQTHQGKQVVKESRTRAMPISSRCPPCGEQTLRAHAFAADRPLSGPSGKKRRHSARAGRLGWFRHSNLLLPSFPPRPWCQTRQFKLVGTCDIGRRRAVAVLMTRPRHARCGIEQR